MPVIFRHQPLQVVDGLIKLTHVQIQDDTPGEITADPSRWNSTESKIAQYDEEAYRRILQKETVLLKCIFCGGEI